MPPSSSPPSSARRRFIEATIATTTAVLAGCVSSREPDPSPAATDPTSWPQFGYDAGNTGYAPDATGPSTSPTIAWRFDGETPTMNASPVVVDGTVYAPGSGDPGYVHAVDAESGEEEWEFEPAGYASSAPAVVDGTVFLGTWGKRVYALDAATGEVEWEEDVGHRIGASSPAVVDGVVYVGTVGDGPLRVRGPEDEEKFEPCALLALDAETGDVEWRYEEFGDRERIRSSPAVADGRVFFGAEDALYALETATGEEAWTRTTPTHPESSPAVADGVVYYGAPSGEGGSPARLWAFDAATAETVWTAGVDDANLRTSPAVADGTVYAAASSSGRTCLPAEGDGGPDCSGENRGRLYAFDAASGERAWTAGIRTDTRSSPAVADGVVYVGCGSGISAVTTDGESAWRLDFEGEREGDPYVDSSPAVTNGRAFVGASDGRLRAITASP